MKRLLTALTILAAGGVHAATLNGTLSASPAVVMLRGSAGQSTSQTVSLMNNTSRDFVFDMAAEDVVVRDGKRVALAAGTVPGSIAATAVFSKNHGVIRPGGTESVEVTLTLPAAAQHRAVVVLFRGSTKYMNGRVPMLASLGTLLTFTLTNDATAAAGPLHIKPQTRTTNLSVGGSCVNTGHEPLVARGVAAIVDGRGALVSKMELPSRRLLPSERAEFEAEYGSELPPGHYKVLVTYDAGGKTITNSGEVEVR